MRELGLELDPNLELAELDLELELECGNMKSTKRWRLGSGSSKSGQGVEFGN